MASDLKKFATNGHAVIDLTSTCNLRCVYCHQSDPQFKGQRIRSGLSSELPKQLTEIGVSSVRFGITGELTVYKGWEAIANEMERAGIACSYLTNLSWKLSKDQIDVLARASELIVSFDTFDPKIHARVRRKSKLETILQNLRDIVDASTAYGSKVKITQNVVVADYNVFTLPNLIREAKAIGIDSVGLIYMIQTNFPADGEYHPIPIDKMSNRQQTMAADAIFQARKISSDLGIDLVMGTLLSDMIKNFEAGQRAKMSGTKSSKLDDMTRNCLSPWLGVEVQSNGDVGPCCILPRYAGSMSDSPLSALVNNQKMTSLREELLKGDIENSTNEAVRQSCAKCPLFGMVPTSELEAKVKLLR